ncbi:MAG: T9SS type A sorting domain-containing protein [Candidatus Zixiibacteriota bacterium]|nr:MAG: T9SS type A sorting domain-containing protein [candidate division Zixibacteria bacterium]
MRALIRAFISLVIMSGLLISNSVAQSQHVNNLPLLMPQLLGDGIKTIPIQSYHDSLFIMSAVFNAAYGVCSERNRFSSWQYRFESSWIMQGMEFIVSPQGGFYVYDIYRSLLMFNFSFTTHDERFCPGRPVIDQSDRIHIMQELSPDNYVYIVSDDTLNSIIVIDTLSNFPYFQRLVANPDHSTIGAVFFDVQNDQILKFLSNNGIINFSNPVIFHEEDLSLGIYDILLDTQNKLVFILGVGSFFANYFVWTEEYRFIYLDTWPDPALEPLCYQICLGPANNEIIVIKNIFSMYYMTTRFFYSSDDGNSWHLSLFNIPDAAYGSSLRTFSDTLHFVYSTDIFGDADTYYYPIPVDSIADNLTSIYDEEEVPVNISLLRAYPNPFNAKTTIEFALAAPGEVELTIYDITGARVETIRGQGLESGRHSMVWDAEDAASGVYFATMEAGGYSQSIKMVLLK